MVTGETCLPDLPLGLLKTVRDQIEVILYLNFKTLCVYMIYDYVINCCVSWWHYRVLITEFMETVACCINDCNCCT